MVTYKTPVPLYGRIIIYPQHRSVNPLHKPLEHRLSSLLPSARSHSLGNLVRPQGCERCVCFAASRIYDGYYYSIPQDETANTIGRVVQGSVVTFTEGLYVLDLTTGFELCTLRIENLPSDVHDTELHALVAERGLEVDHFYFVGIKKTAKGTLGTKLVTDKRSAEILSSVSGSLTLRVLH